MLYILPHKLYLWLDDNYDGDTNDFQKFAALGRRRDIQRHCGHQEINVILMVAVSTIKTDKTSDTKYIDIHNQ